MGKKAEHDHVYVRTWGAGTFRVCGCGQIGFEMPVEPEIDPDEIHDGYYEDDLEDNF